MAITSTGRRRWVKPSGATEEGSTPNLDLFAGVTTAPSTPPSTAPRTLPPPTQLGFSFSEPEEEKWLAIDFNLDDKLGLSEVAASRIRDALGAALSEASALLETRGGIQGILQCDLPALKQAIEHHYNDEFNLSSSEGGLTFTPVIHSSQSVEDQGYGQRSA